MLNPAEEEENPTMKNAEEEEKTPAMKNQKTQAMKNAEEEEKAPQNPEEEEKTYPEEEEESDEEESDEEESDEEENDEEENGEPEKPRKYEPWKYRRYASYLSPGRKGAEEKGQKEGENSNRNYYQIIHEATSVIHSIQTEKLLKKENVHGLLHLFESQKMSSKLHKFYDHYFPSTFRILDKYLKALLEPQFEDFMKSHHTLLLQHFGRYGGALMMSACKNMEDAFAADDLEGIKSALHKLRAANTTLHSKLTTLFGLGVELGLPAALGTFREHF